MTSRSYTLRRLVFRLSVGLFQTVLAVALCVFVFSVSAPATFAQEKGKTVSFDIPAGDAVKALKQFSAQSGQQILYSNEDLVGVSTNMVKGRLSVHEALDQLLAKTPLAASRDDSNGAVAVGRKADPNAQRLAQKNSDQPDSQKGEIKNGVLKLETFEVMGSKLLNMDKPRSRDDAQPYVVFNREVITNSGATDLQDFLKQRLTMNAVARSNVQQVTVLGDTSSINLRGLGVGQTLILVDGHRIAGIQQSGIVFQGDLNGIPLAAVERIEVLPTTASGIYGGSATGGVVNVILRRDYAGAEVSLSYENSFATDSAIRRIDFSAGLTLEHGKTQVLLAASYSDANSLLAQDTGLVTAGRAAILANNPGFFLNAATPPVGATPNIRSSNGSNLVLKTGAALNSPFTSIPAGYAGTSSDGGAALVANAGRYDFDLAQSTQSGGGGLAGLLGTPTIKSLSSTVRRQFTPQLQAFLDLAVAENESFIATNAGALVFSLPVTSPNNPFTQAITVQTGSAATDAAIRSVNGQKRMVAGLLAKLPWEWQGEVDYNWNQARTYSENQPLLGSAVSTALATGSPDIMRDLRAYPIDLSAFLSPILSSPRYTTLRDGTLRLAGPLGSLPAGPVTLSSLFEYRDESVSDSTTNFVGILTSYTPSRSQSIYSEYLEARVPIFSPQRPSALIREMDLQLAVRRDDYTLNGTTGNITVGSGAPVDLVSVKRGSTDFTAGLRLMPVKDVVFRASYGTGFVPPNLTQLVPSIFNLSVAGLTDPLRGNTAVAPAGFTGASGIIPTLIGGSPTLRPELSKSWSVGVIFTPRVVPGLRLSLDYTDIKKTDNIANVSTQNIINNESILPGRVTRGPIPAGDPFNVGPIIFVDTTAVNISMAQLEAFDAQLDFETLEAGWGKLELFVTATQQTHFKTQLVPSAPIVENVGVGNLIGATSSPPLKFRASGGLNWKRGPWTVGWAARYFDSYQTSTNAVQILNQGNGGIVPSQIYHDVFVKYRFGSTPAAGRMSVWLARMELQVGIKNVFNKRPPLDAASAAYFYSNYGDPRLSCYQVALKKSF